MNWTRNFQSTNMDSFWEDIPEKRHFSARETCLLHMMFDKNVSRFCILPLLKKDITNLADTELQQNVLHAKIFSTKS